MNFIAKLKDLLKNFCNASLVPVIRNAEKMPIIRYLPKGRNHLFDIVVEEKQSTNYKIIDVGANVGQTAMFYNRYLDQPKIICFEPVQSTFDQLVRNTAGKKNIMCVQSALGAARREGDILIRDESGRCSLSEKVRSEEKGPQSLERVSIDTLDNFMRNSGLERIDILKIDAEGYDLEVLLGAEGLFKKNLIRYVFCEVSFYGESDKGDFFKIKEYLKKYGFWLCGFYDPVRWGKSYTYLAFHNALFKKVVD